MIDRRIDKAILTVFCFASNEMDLAHGGTVDGWIREEGKSQ